MKRLEAVNTRTSYYYRFRKAVESMFVNRPELRLGLLILPKSADLKIIKTIAVLEATSSLPNTNAHTRISQGF